MGFLSVYSGVKRVPIGDPERGYWVDLREHVSHGARESAERALTAMSVVNGKASVSPDVTQYRQLLLGASIAAWNLDEEDGSIWPVTPANIQRLPGDVFDKLWVEIDTMNSPRSAEETQQFRDGDVSGDPHGDGGTAVA